MAEQYTGKTRHRPGFRKTLVLQVECTQDHIKPFGGTGYYDEWTTTYWRDATIMDLQALERVSKCCSGCS